MLKMKKVICCILSFSVFIGTVAACPTSAAGKDKNLGKAASGGIRYTSAALDGWTGDAVSDSVISPSVQSMLVDAKPVSDASVKLSAGAVLSFDFTVDRTADYVIAVKYYPINALYMDCLLDLTADGNGYVTALPLVWADKNLSLIHI